MASTKIRGITIELNADTAGILDGLKDVNSSLSKTDKALRDVDKLLKFDDSNTELLAQQQEYLNRAIEQTEEKLKKEKEILESMKSADNADQTREQQNALAREIEATSAKLNEYKGKLNQTDDALSEVTDETKKASDASLTFGDVLKANIVGDLVVEGIKKLATGIKDVAVNAMTVGSEFEASMSQVAATMGMTSAEIEGGSEAYRMLEDAARKCGATTQYTASQAAEALNYLALAGYDAERAAETLPKVLTLAAAGGMDLAYASDLITDSMSALGMSTEELDNYMDEMAVTAQKANTSVAQLGEATLVCAGAVSLTGQDLETMNTELGLLADNGIKGAEGGTHLRNILLSLSAPTEKAEKAIQALGLQIADSQGNMRDLNDIMLDLNAALDGMGSADKAAVIKQIFNKTDIAAVNALMKGSVEEFGNLKNEIENCEGAAKAMAETMMDNLQGKITILKSALEGLGVSFYDIFDDDAKTAVTAATRAVDSLQDAITNGELGQSLEELSAAFGNLMEEMIMAAEDALPGIIDGATWFIDNLDTIIDLIKGVAAGYVAYEAATLAATIATEGFTMALELNPIGLAVAAIAGLTVAMVELWQSTNELNPEVEKFVHQADQIVDKTNNMASSSEKLVDSFSAQSKYVEELKNRLNELQSKTSLTAAEQKEQADIIAKLNAIVPDLNLSIDEQGRLVSTATENWEAYVDAMLREAEITAIQEKLIEITEQRIDAEMSLAEIEEKLDDQTKEQIALEEERNALLERKNTLTDEELRRLDELSGIIDPLTDEQRAYAEEHKKTADALENLNEKQEQLTERLGESQEALEQNTEATKEGVDANGEFADSVSEITEELEKEQDALEKTVESQVASFEKIKEASAISIDDVIENLRSNVQAMEDWAENMNTLAERGIDDGLLQHLAEMGPAGAAQVQEFVNATAEQLEEASQVWQEAMSSERFSDQIAEDYMTAGSSVGEALVTGMSSPIEDGSIDEVANEMVSNLINSDQWERLPEEVRSKIIGAQESMAEQAAEDTLPAESLVESVVNEDVWAEMPETIKTHIIAAKEAMAEAITEDEENNPGIVLADTMTDGFIEESEARAEEISEATQTSVTDPIKQTIDEQFQTAEGAPSQVMIDYGANFITSLAQGMEDQKEPILLAKIRSLIDESFKTIETYLQWNGTYYMKWWDVGLKVDQSIAQGITDNQDLIAQALQSAFDNAMNGIDMGSFTGMINKALGSLAG